MSVASSRKRVIVLATAALALWSTATAAQEQDCRLLCTPDLKFEPTVTFENLGTRARVDVGGTVEETERETVVEFIFAVGVPTTIPRVGLTFEAVFAPFKGPDGFRDNPPEIELELNLDLFSEESTGGWLSSHFDIVDKFSPGELPGDASAYTHKLDMEIDTALHLFSFLPDGRWLRNLELELSLDYLVSGRPQAGDQIGGETYLDDESPWSASLVLVMPLAPLVP
ncbi:MAG: hypothetical protein ABL963_05040 [Longimicrobiales bacterium]